MAKGVERDIAGARASNAGDRFHELWALRKALSLLEPNPRYQAITVEGVPRESASPNEGTWTAVDVCLMSGGHNLSEATWAEFAQLKYSSASPEALWTVARLSSNSAKRGNNSVIRKLAEAFLAAEGVRTGQNSLLQYAIRLVSNQNVSPDVFLALGRSRPVDAAERSKARKDGHKLRTATGLTAAQFNLFASLLDFSECGAESNFEQERKAIECLDRLIEGDSKPSHLELHRFISDAMLPESSRAPITEATVLSRLDVSSDTALYPCPNRVVPVSQAIERPIARAVVSNLVNGVQRIALHGGAGCGKTTTITQIATMLPPGSICIQYDCYGGGSYLDDSAPRHRPQEAFTQLSNELAVDLRVPRLLRISERGNAAKAFKDRLDQGAQILYESNPPALLVVAVDAADNAVAAAKRRNDHCFVNELASLGDLPSNVRILVSARTARLAELELPMNFKGQLIESFSLSETEANVAIHIPEPDVHWTREFHELTRGVPRVQAYAFELSRVPGEAMQYLLPSGKGLDEIFEQAFENAWRKGGDAGSIPVLCAALISLPRPIPLVELAFTIDKDFVRAKDLCEDLGRTLVIKDDCVSFSDEDFEHFVAQRGSSKSPLVRAKIAERLLANEKDSAYACRHVVQALIVAGRDADALRVATQEPEGRLFADPVERRLCQLERMRGALRVCARSGSPSESMYILMVGAEALRTSDAIAKALALNPDLSARYARESLDRLVLSDERFVQANGPVLCHLMAEDAKRNLSLQVERARRFFLAWRDKQADDREYREYSQQPTAADVAAFYRAEAARTGVDAVLRRFRRHGPRREEIFRAFVTALLGEGNFELVEGLLADPKMPAEAKVYVTSLLAKAGRQIDLDMVGLLLKRLQVRGKLRESTGQRRAAYTGLFGDCLTLCELLARNGEGIDIVHTALTEMAQGDRPRWRHLELSQHGLIDVILRAESLLSELDEGSLTLDGLLDVESATAMGWSSDSELTYDEHQKRSDAIEFFRAYLPFYQARARYVVTGQLEEFAGAAKARWSKALEAASYLSSRTGARGMHFVVADAMTAALAFDNGRIGPLFDVVRVD